MNVDMIIEQAVNKIKENLPVSAQVILFGSWAQKKAIKTSDIDIGILGQKPIPWSILVKIKEEIDQIPTLRSIDVVDLRSTSPQFRQYALTHAKKL